MKITLHNGDMLTLSNVVYTITKLDVSAGKVLGAWLSKSATPDAGGDTLVGSIDVMYLTAAMLRQRLS